MRGDRGARLWIAVALVATTIVFLRTAWVAEDAYITYRVADNVIHGHGPTWNTAERVQAFTHPLWLFLIAFFHAFTRDVYFTGIVLSIVVSLAALAVLAFFVAGTTASAVLGLLVLLLSRAFVDYSTCGLENPLTHLLAATFLFLWYRTDPDVRRFSRLCFVGALLLLTRMDMALLVAPALLVAGAALPRGRALKAAIIAFTPFFAWEVFSLVYYGAFVPNTAYAKLSTGIPRVDLAQQGMYYLSESLRHDPLTLTVIASGIMGAWIARNRGHVALAVGCVLYLGYVVSIGGDFMSGRFLTPVLLVAVAMISRYEVRRARVWAPVAVAIALIGCATAAPTVTSGRSYGTKNRPLVRGIANERGFYFQQTGLFRSDGTFGVDNHPKAIEGKSWRDRGWHARLAGMVGILGYYSGPDAHILDGFALADPLLSHLPERELNWRIGHFVREVPLGYLNSLLYRNNTIEDPRIKEFYDAVRIVTRGRILDGHRFAVIWKMNTGGYRRQLEPFYQARRLQDEASRQLVAGRFGDVITTAGLATQLDPRRAAAWFLLSRAYRETGDLDRARNAAATAATILPEEYLAELVAVGEAFDVGGDLEQATAVYRQVLAIDPDREATRARLNVLDDPSSQDLRR